MSWEAFTAIVCKKLQLRGVRSVTHAETGRGIASTADLATLQDIDNIVRVSLLCLLPAAHCAPLIPPLLSFLPRGAGHRGGPRPRRGGRVPLGPL